MEILETRLLSLGKKNSKLSPELNIILSSFDSDKDNGFEILSELNKQIGQHHGHILQSLLVKIRDQFVTDFITYEKDRLDSIFAKSPEKGSQQWFNLIITSISEFNDLFQTKFCQFDFPFPKKYVATIHEVKGACYYILNDCWADAYPVIEHLSGLDFISENLKVHLIVIMGEIQQYHFSKKYKADVLFRKAEALLPKHLRTLVGKAYYLQSLNDLETSRAYFNKLIELYPDRSIGYHGIAEILETTNESPESWYYAAIQHAPGDSSAYLKLAKYFTKIDADGNAGKIDELKRKAILVSPESEYSSYIEMGFIFIGLKQYDTAIEHYKRAITIDKKLSRGYLEIGYAYLAMPEKSYYESARENFKKVVELLPGSISGYWAMAYAYTLEGNYVSALEWYKKCPERIIDYNDKIRGGMGDAYIHLNDHVRAEQELRKAFSVDKESDWAKVYMEQLAQHYYEKKNDKESAVRLYKEVLDNLGQSYRASYENRMGNTYYYFSEYEKAAEHYRNAIDHNPEYLQFQKNLALAYNAIGNNFYSARNFKEAAKYYEEALKLDSTEHIYYDNLSKAYTEENDFDKALKQLERAREINPTQEYEDKIQMLKVKKELLPKYGHKNLKLIPVVTPVSVEVAKNLISLLSTGNELTPAFQSLISTMRDGLQHKFGHEKIPGIRVRGNETDLRDDNYVIMINEIPLASDNVRLGWALCNETVDRLTLLSIKAEKAVNPVNGSECAWIPLSSVETVTNIGLQTWNAPGYIMLHLCGIISKNFSEFVTIQTVVRQLSLKYYSEIAAMAGGIPRFTNVLKVLVEEEVPIKELDTLCEAYSYHTAKGITSYEIVEELRNHPKIKPFLPGNQGNSEYCLVYELSDDLARLITDGVRISGDGALLALEPEPTQEILTAVRNEVSNLLPTSENPVIMTKDWRIRRHIRKLVELEFPHLAVMSEREIAKKIKSLATIATSYEFKS